MKKTQLKFIGLSMLAMAAALASFLHPNSAPVEQRNTPVASVSTTPEPERKRFIKSKVRSRQAKDVVEPAPVILFPQQTENTITVTKQPELAKLDGFRNPVEDNSDNWHCVIDRTTGLVWEVKTDDHGLQDRNNYYSWYEPKQVLVGIDPGKQDNGNCRGGINCDTHAYIQAINAMKTCGYSDWRLPTRSELMSLVQYNENQKNGGLINRKFFPHGSVDWYWTADTDADDGSYAWYVLFYNGRSMKAPKSQAKRIRLVRGGETKRSLKNFAEQPDKSNTENLAIDTSYDLRVIEPETLPSS